uniref:selenocysteine lyase n=1 Tax=Myxine glutinosa TaxID=7769 RepID=UPI00358EEF18
METPNEETVYLDYNATTPVEKEVQDVILQALQEAWGNPSSAYSAGRKANELVSEARQQVAQMIGASPADIIFTSGGTEVVLAVYLDYNATTPVEKEVQDVILQALQEAWGNPSSAYSAGRKANELVSEARQQVAQMIGASPADIIFTSGGTEANGLVFHTAVKHFWAATNGLAEGQCQRRPHIITTTVEHDSVCLTAKHLVEEDKADVTYVEVSSQTGQVDVVDVLAAVRPNTILVSIMLANNETGVIMPIAEIGQRVHDLCKGPTKHRPILIHTDAAQALGKVHVDVNDLGVDYLTIVGHKFYGPRIGALFVRDPGSSTPLFPMLFGGGQERCFRPGTENTPMIAGLGKAAQLVFTRLDEDETRMQDLKDYLEDQLKNKFGKEKLHFNNHFEGSKRLPNTCNVSILGDDLQGYRVLAHSHRLFASTGAACHSSQKNRPSPVLLKCGIPAKIARNALRLSLGRFTTRKHIDIAVAELYRASCELESASIH